MNINLLYIKIMSVEKTYYYTGVFTLKNVFANEEDALQNKEPIEPYTVYIADIKFNKAQIKKENADARNIAEVISS